ncbi:MAG: divalent-cation tolerance protein CutA [Acidobacteriota bacterium]|nr:divalent-cation tolerance protein CutA [Acidobacteriota bacterium]
MNDASDAEAVVVVLMTAASREEAVRIAQMLVGARLAACVQVMPEMESIYRWEGEVLRAPEVLLLAKTTVACFAELEREVRALHSYETPEIIALPVNSVSIPYLEWLTGSVLQRRGVQPVERASSAGTGSVV